MGGWETIQMENSWWMRSTNNSSSAGRHFGPNQDPLIFWQATISNPAWTKISSEINYISSHLINQTQKYKHLDLTTKNKTHNTIIRTLGPVKEEEEIPRVLNKDTTLEVSWGRCLTSKSGPIVVKPLASQRGSLLFLILQLDSDWNIFRPLPQSKIAS